jgi:magnesium transporter
VPAHLIDSEGAHAVELSRETVERLRDGAELFWLDIHKPSAEDIPLLGEVFAFHPLALEDATHFGQRSKLEEYDGFDFLVVFGAAPDADDLVEVHCFYGERFVITVRRDDCPAFVDTRRRHEERPRDLGEPGLLLHRIVDALADSFVDLLGDLDELMDALDDAIFRRPGEEYLQRLFREKRRLIRLRKVVAPQRDLVAAIASGVALPDISDEARRSFRDVHDHLLRLTETLDGYRDHLADSTEVYLSAASNRLADVTKRLAVIATIFLPLTFITGFFGQNFGWLVDAVGGELEFWVLGVGLQLASITLLLALFRRRGWF